MKCPVCGTAELIHDTRDITYTYKGETTVILAVTGDFCPACDESVTDMAETDRVMREMKSFRTQFASSNDSDSPSSKGAELQKLRSALLAGAASQPGRAVDGAYFQSLRATVATSQLSGLGSSHQNDRTESKCQPMVAIEDLISGINADNLHEEADFGSPVGKEKL